MRWKIERKRETNHQRHHHQRAKPNMNRQHRSAQLPYYSYLSSLWPERALAAAKAAARLISLITFICMSRVFPISWGSVGFFLFLLCHLGLFDFFPNQWEITNLMKPRASRKSLRSSHGTAHFGANVRVYMVFVLSCCWYSGRFITIQTMPFESDWMSQSVFVVWPLPSGSLITVRRFQLFSILLISLSLSVVCCVCVFCIGSVHSMLRHLVEFIFLLSPKYDCLFLLLSFGLIKFNLAEVRLLPVSSTRQFDLKHPSLHSKLSQAWFYHLFSLLHPSLSAWYAPFWSPHIPRCLTY